MTKEVRISDVIHELKETAEHMNNLAVLLEKAQELEDIQSKLNSLLTDPALVRALIGTNIAENSQPEPAKPEPVQQEPVTKPKTITKAAQTKPVRQKPEPEPEPKPEPVNMTSELKRIEQKYHTYGYDIEHVAKPPETWTEEKIKTVLKQTAIHPDSITSTGTLVNRPWTWMQVNYVVKYYNLNTPESMQIAAGHTPQEIRLLLHSLNLTRIKAERKTDSLEKYLPEEIQNPTPNARLKIYRIMCNMTLDELTYRTGIKKKYLMAIESNTRQMTTAQRDKIAEALSLERASMTTMPITDILSLDDTYDAKSRLKTLRLRFGMTESEMAARIGSDLEQYKTCEANGPTKEQAQRICMSMKINTKLFESCYQTNQTRESGSDTKQTSGLDNVQHTTAEKLYNMRKKMGVSTSELSNMSGVSVSYITQIEKGAHNPSETILRKLAFGLKCTIADIQGTQNTNIKPLKTL